MNTLEKSLLVLAMLVSGCVRTPDPLTTAETLRVTKFVSILSGELSPTPLMDERYRTVGEVQLVAELGGKHQLFLVAKDWNRGNILFLDVTMPLIMNMSLMKLNEMYPGSFLTRDSLLGNLVLGSYDED